MEALASISRAMEEKEKEVREDVVVVRADRKVLDESRMSVEL